MGSSLGIYENGTTREIFWRCIDLVLWAYEGASRASHSVALYIPEMWYLIMWYIANTGRVSVLDRGMMGNRTWGFGRRQLNKMCGTHAKRHDALALNKAEAPTHARFWEWVSAVIMDLRRSALRR